MFYCGDLYASFRTMKRQRSTDSTNQLRCTDRVAPCEIVDPKNRSDHIAESESGSERTTGDTKWGGVTSHTLQRSSVRRGIGMRSGMSTDAGGMDANVHVHDIETYVKFRAFDVIGNGSYRKYVNSCRERGESWAVRMQESVVQANSATKVIQQLVSDLQKANKTGLYLLCQTIIENNTPPIDQNTVISECSVSGKAKSQCIVLKCKGRGAPSITVQSRFGHFVLMLWTVFKMDLVIKTLTRDFIDKLGDADQHTMADLCEKFVTNNESITRLSHAMLHAIQHVKMSLHHALMS